MKRSHTRGTMRRDIQSTSELRHHSQVLRRISAALCYIYRRRMRNDSYGLMQSASINLTLRNEINKVRLMRRIYANATRVIAWIGDEDDMTELALANWKDVLGR